MSILRFLKLVLPIFLVLLVAGCSGDDSTGPEDDDDPNELALGQMRAQINGANFTSVIALATNTPSVGQVVAVSGSSAANANQTTIAFAFIVAANSNSYTIGEVGTNAILTTRGVSYRAPAGGDSRAKGAIPISVLNAERIAGTFEFVVINNEDSDDVLSVTNGRFNIPFRQ